MGAPRVCHAAAFVRGGAHLVAGQYARPVTVSSMPFFSSMTATGFLESPAQILTCRSYEPVMTQLLSGSKVTAEIAPSWHSTGPSPICLSLGMSREIGPSASPFLDFFFSPPTRRVESVSHMQSRRS